MTPIDLSRRRFVLATAAGLVSTRLVRAQSPQLTAQVVTDRIRAAIGSPWREKTIDGFKAGDPSTVVTGVATTVMATLDVLQRAAAAGQNFVVTQEPVFYGANDEPGNRAQDPVYLAKKAFIDQKRLVVWRFSDHWAARTPNQSAAALATKLGWRSNSTGGAADYLIPETTLGALIADVRKRLEIRGGLRSVGNDGMRVRNVFVSPGGPTVPSTAEALRQADVILTGEPREWEVVPYALDTWASERGKGLISIGRLVSESPGMEACAVWLRTLIPEVTVAAVAVSDPYWRPQS